MLDYNVFAVVRVSGHEVCVHDFAVRDGSHLIQRLAASIALQRANVDSFMKTRVGKALSRLHRIANESVLAALPRRGFHAFVNAFYILIKLWAGAAKERVVIGR